MKRVCTKHLDVALSESGPKDGPVALLLHGWPDDATTWSRIAPRLNAAGFRTVAPMLRGSGGTRFRSPRTAHRQHRHPRRGRHGAVAGHDWGSNVAEMLAVGWPRRVTRIAMLASPSRLGGLRITGFERAHRYWYHWLQATRRGTEFVTRHPIDFARYMGDNRSPAGWFDEATFEAVAKSFRNPDWVPVMLHSYGGGWRFQVP